MYFGEHTNRFYDGNQKTMNICSFLMILVKKKLIMGKKIRFCEKEVGNFSTSKCPKNGAFQNFSKNNF